MTMSTLDNLLENFSLEIARKWLRQVFNSYDDTVNLQVGFDKENPNEKNYFQEISSLGVIRKLPESKGAEKNCPLIVVAVKMKQNLTERSSRMIQFRLAKRLLEKCANSVISGLSTAPTQGLFFFYAEDGSCYRFSLVSGDFSKRGTIKLNDAKRQSFFIDTEKANNVFRRRFAKQIKSYQELQEAFSVEGLTKEFYDRLFAWFCWVTDDATNITYPNDSKDNQTKAFLAQGVIRLVTRLMFVWFVRQKNLISAELFDKEKLTSLLKSFDADSMEDDNYYRCILQNLFFATLNCPSEKRKFQKFYNGKSNERGVKTCYRYEDEFIDSEAFKQKVSKVPFLNCSLFECLDRVTEEGERICFDGFSSRKECRAHIPNGIFFKKEFTHTIKIEEKSKLITGFGLIELFNHFDFTVDENYHNDADIALDPELLGKVFENLLGAYDPKSGLNMRNATGSFYTPREIVNYMVETSLREYLKRQISVPGYMNLDVILDQIFDESEEKKQLNIDVKIQQQILSALYDCKIFDPACGSGAYPMGILQTMVRLLNRLDPFNVEQFKRIEAYYKESSSEIETERDNKERIERIKLLDQQRKEGRMYPDYARKLYLIENCIYGCDLQPIAVQISKLRFFISLLCDQLKQNWDPNKENYGFLSLPNLETKFVCADTLLRLPKLNSGELNLATGDIYNLRLEMQRNRRKIFYARTSETKEKYREKDKEIRERIRETIKHSGTRPDENVIKEQESIIEKLKKQFEAVREPCFEERFYQQGLYGITDELPITKTIDVNERPRKELARQILSAEEKIKAERNKENNAGTTALDQLAHKIAMWNPYDQNATADFFDSSWMFNIEKGFDIVIGNPPYIRLQKMAKEIVARYEDENYSSFTKNGDIYCLFYERGIELLKEKGILAYITSNKWMRTVYGEKLRAFLCHKNPIWLLDFGGARIFKEASVDTNILVISNEPCKEKAKTIKFSKNEAHNVSNLLNYCKKNYLENEFSSGESWAILSSIEHAIKKKIDANGTPLKDWDIRINYGIKTGANKAFIISSETRNEILANCRTKEERLRTEELIRPHIRGRDIQRYSYNWDGEWLIALFPSKHYDIEDYPSVKKHLLSFGKERLEQTGKKYTIDGLEIKSRKKNNNKWFETQDSIAYWEDFNKMKICWNRIAPEKSFALVEPGFYVQDSMHFIVGENLMYLCSMLNSKLIQVYLSCMIGDAAGGNAGNADNILNLSIPKTEQDRKVDDLEIYQLYGLTPEEIDYIEHYGEAPQEEVPEKKSAKPKSKRPTSQKPTLTSSPEDDEDDYLE